MLPITLGGVTLTTYGELLGYLNRTPMDVLKVQLPATFELTALQIYSLGTQPDGFLARISPELADKILYKYANTITSDQLGILPPAAFNTLHDVLTLVQLNSIPQAIMTNFLNLDKPAKLWGINIAKWISVPDSISSPYYQTICNAIRNMHHRSWGFLSPSFFDKITPLLFDDLFITKFPGKQTDVYNYFTNIQLQRIPAVVMNRILIEFNIIPIGILNRLNFDQQKFLDLTIIKKISKEAFMYMKPRDLAVLFSSWGDDQLKSLSPEIFQLLDDTVYRAMVDLGAQTRLNFIDKISLDVQLRLSPVFFEGMAAGLDAVKHDLLTNYSPPGDNSENPYLNLFKVLTPGDAKQMNLKFFQHMDRYIEHIPALFFKGMSPEQIQAIPDGAIKKLTTDQVLSIGNKVFEMNLSQLIIIKELILRFDYNLFSEIDKNISNNAVDLTNEVWKAALSNVKASLQDPTNLIRPDSKTGLMLWDSLNSREKAHLLVTAIDNKTPYKITNTLTREQLVNMDPEIGRILMAGYANFGRNILTTFIRNLLRSSEGAGIFFELLGKGFFDEAYRAVMDKVTREVNSSGKYDAQVFIMVGPDFRQIYSSLGLAFKMPETVPTLIYHYNSVTQKTELIKTVNGKINGIEQTPEALLGGKKKIRTYLYGHGYADKVTIGGGIGAMGSGYDSTGLSPGKCYQIITDLWNKLAPGALSSFTKLTIAGCEMASPPRLTDENGKRIPNTPNAWSDRFTESFLGQISKVFMNTPDGPYRNSLNISAFITEIQLILGKITAAVGSPEDPQYPQLAYKSRSNKIAVKWDDQTHRISFKQSGAELGELIKNSTMIRPESIDGFAVNHLYENEPDLYDNMFHELAMASIEPDSLQDFDNDLRGSLLFSPDKDLDNNKILVLQENSEDGDLPSRHYVWDVDEISDSRGPVRTTRDLNIISSNGEGGAGKRYANALKELQNFRLGIAEITRNTDAVMRLPDFASLSAADQQKARISVSALGGVIPTADYQSLKATHGSVLKVLEVMVTRKVEHNMDMDAQGELALNAITAMDATNSKKFFTDNGLTIWGTDNSITLNIEKLHRFITTAESTDRFRLMAALMRLSESDGNLLLSKFKDSGDQGFRKLAEQVEEQRKNIVKSKSEVADIAHNGVSNAIEIYSTVVGIYSLIKGWDTASDEQKALDLTGIVGGPVASIANYVVMKSIAQTTKTLAGAGMPLTRAMKITTGGFVALDFAFVAVTMASVGLQWSDFWKSGRGINSYEYKSLVASTVSTVVFAAAGLALGAISLAASLSTLVASTVLGSIAAAAGPIGIVIAIAGIIINGIIQGAMIISEYYSYFDNDAERVEQFFASWIGLETDALKRARARKEGQYLSGEYLKNLNDNWSKTQEYLIKRYQEEGFERIVYGGKNPHVEPYTFRVDGMSDYDNVLNSYDTTGIRDLVDKHPDNPDWRNLRMAFLGDNFRDPNYSVGGSEAADNLFDLRDTYIKDIRGYGKNDTYLLNRFTTLDSNRIYASTGKNIINLDAGGSEVRVERTWLDGEYALNLIYQGDQKGYLVQDSHPNLNAHIVCDPVQYTTQKNVRITGNIEQLIITNASKVLAGWLYTPANNVPVPGILFNVSGIEGADLEIHGDFCSNVVIAHEGLKFYSSDNDIIFWNGDCDVSVHLENRITSLNTQLMIRFTKDYRQLTACKSGKDLKLSHKGKTITIKDLYEVSNSKIITVQDITGHILIVNSANILRSTATYLNYLPKTFLLLTAEEKERIAVNNGSSSQDSVRRRLIADQSVNTYSFFKDAGHFLVDFHTQQFAQLLLEAPDGKVRYKKNGSDLLLECQGQYLSIRIARYVEFYNQSLLKVVLKTQDTSAGDFAEMELPDFDKLTDGKWVDYQLPSKTFSSFITDPGKIIDLQALEFDEEITSIALAEAGNQLHLSIPEGSDSSRIIQCRQENDLLLYFADNANIDVVTKAPPHLIVREVFKTNQTNLKMFLHQYFQEIESGEYNQIAHHALELAVEISIGQEIKGYLEQPDDEDWYVFPIKKSIQYGIGITMNTGECELETLYNSTINNNPIRARAGGSMFPRSNQKALVVSSSVGNDRVYVRVLRQPDIASGIGCHYTLQIVEASLVPRGTAVAQSPISYSRVPRMSELTLYPTRLLSHNSPFSLNGTDYSVISKAGSTKSSKYYIDMSNKNRFVWTVDNTSIYQLSDILELGGNIRFLDLNLLVSGTDLGLFCTIEDKLKTVWIKDFMTNPSASGLSVILPHYIKAGDTDTDAIIRFILPIYDPSSGWWVVPRSEIVGIPGRGSYLLSLDPYEKQVTKLFVSEALYRAAKEGAKREIIGEDLRISTEDNTQVLYLKNYYRCPLSVEIIAVEEKFNTHNVSKNINASPLPVLGRTGFILATSLGNREMIYNLVHFMNGNSSGDLSNISLDILIEYLNNHDESLPAYLDRVEMNNFSNYFGYMFENVPLSKIEGLKAAFLTRNTLTITDEEKAILGLEQTPQQRYDSELISLTNQLTSLNSELNQFYSIGGEVGSNTESRYLNDINAVNRKLQNLKQWVINIYVDRFNAIISEKSNNLIQLTPKNRKCLRMLLTFSKVARDTGRVMNAHGISYINNFIWKYLLYIHWSPSTDVLWEEKDAAYVMDMFALGMLADYIICGIVFKLTLAQVKAYFDQINDLSTQGLVNFQKFALVVSGIIPEENQRSIPEDMQGWGVSRFDIKVYNPDKIQKILTAILESRNYFTSRKALLKEIMVPTDSTKKSFLSDPIYVTELIDAGLSPTNSKIEKLVKQGITGFDIKTNNDKRLGYESGKRNHLISVTTTAGLGNQEQATYRILKSSVNGAVLRPKSLVSDSNFQAGYITDKYGGSLLPEQLQPDGGEINNTLNPQAARKIVAASALYWFFKQYKGTSLWVERTPAGVSWFGRSTPDNLVNGKDKPGELYAWRPAVHYGIDGEPLDISFDTSNTPSGYQLREWDEWRTQNMPSSGYVPNGSTVTYKVSHRKDFWLQASDVFDYVGPQTVTFEFSDKILVTAMQFSLGYEVAVKDKPSKNRTGRYRIEAETVDGVWLIVSEVYGPEFTWPTPIGINLMFITINTKGVPYKKYRLVGLSATADRDCWIQEVYFTTEPIS
ncbi:hypothetical protein [Chryseobacterium sp. OSA05B]|uniref:hypothetical protein n=1 Tax=Chryseobacterium sp. OSA05B TaxID=2862650 RepID=UPI001CBFE8D9|nr:hypothetical protein [Chryseobacterium sp. OSA05B]